LILAWVGPPPVELEPWTITVHAVGKNSVPAVYVQDFDMSVPQLNWGIERLGADGWKPVRVAEPLIQGASTVGKELWCEVRIIDPQVTGVPGDYRVTVAWSGRESGQSMFSPAEPVSSNRLPVQETAHAGNRAAMAALAMDFWHPLGLILGARPMYPAIGDAAQVESHWLAAISWGKSDAVSPGLRSFAALFEAEATMAAAGYRFDQQAAATRSLWSRAKQLLEGLDTSRWDGPTGGFAGDVLRARIVCARALGDAGTVGALTATLQRTHPHAWPPADNHAVAPMRIGPAAVPAGR
jgi:hypothetical protein